MPIFKPLTELQNNSREISNLVQASKEPVFLTENGESDMVLMSAAFYHEMQARLTVYSKLAVAQSQLNAGEKSIPLKDSVRKIRRMLDAQKQV